MAEKKLFLLDGHALVYRAHFAFINRPLVNSKGMNTSAVSGFTRTLWDLLKNQDPTHIAVAFDPEEPTFRHDMFEDYKAHREEQPEDIAIAIPYIKKILHAFDIPIVTVAGYEADDVIGTLAKQAEKEGYTVYMVTPDKDFCQLVDENIYLYKPSRQGNGVEIWGIEEVLDKWDIKRVEQVIDILAMQGDTVDNIPGIPGIGAKTAAKLLNKYDSVEGLYEHLDELKGKQKERIAENREQSLISKKLATIDLEAPIKFDPETYQRGAFNREELSEIFKELEFRTLARQILGEGEEAQSPAGQQGSLFAREESSSAPPQHSVAEKNLENTEHTYYLVDTPEKRQELLQKLEKQPSFCFDTETTGIDPNEAELVGIAFATQAGEAYYLPVPEDRKATEAIIGEFKALFENEKIAKIAQNIKYDIIVLKWYGLEVRGALYDTMIMHYLLEPELRHNMDYLAETYLKYQPVPIEQLIGKKGKHQKNMRDIDLATVKEYAAEDADITLQLNEWLYPWLKKEKLEGLYHNIEEPLIRTLVDMEYEGVNVDIEFLKAYSKELDKGIGEVEKKVFAAAGVEFNIASPRQVGEVLFETMEIPYSGRKTKSGQYSTNEEKLSELAKEYEIAGDILKHRALTKLKSTYVDALPKMVNPRTGRIHSSFNQALAATGRLSSNNPNLQNIPVRTPEGARIREAFVPRNEDYTLLAADYSQIELRLIAEISGDEAMLEAFQSGKDIHSSTAARVFGVSYDEVSREQRYRAKTVNFAIIYGAGPSNLSQQLGIRRTEAKELIEQYFAQYQGLKHYMEKTVEDARKYGYVKTLMGRRRYLRDIKSRNSVIRAGAERNAINTPIQGAAADMIKIAMVQISQAMYEKNFQSKMILQVHDELVFDALKSEVEALKPLIKEKMAAAIPDLKVPIVVDIGEGKNWWEAH